VAEKVVEHYLSNKKDLYSKKIPLVCCKSSEEPLDFKIHFIPPWKTKITPTINETIQKERENIKSQPQSPIIQEIMQASKDISTRLQSKQTKSTALSPQNHEQPSTATALHKEEPAKMKTAQPISQQNEQPAKTPPTNNHTKTDKSKTQKALEDNHQHQSKLEALKALKTKKN
jgi:hypothetical protein